MIQKDSERGFEFLITDRHLLKTEFSNIHSVRQALKRGVVFLTCYNLGKRYVLYDTFTKQVLRTEWIAEHCGSTMEYTRPEAIPT